MTSNVTVVDAVMGQGKTTAMIEYVNDHLDENFVVVVPTRSEVERYAEGIERETFCPHLEEKSGDERLLDLFHDAVFHNKTIITTHALLERWDDESVTRLKRRSYTLILDEVLSVVQPFAISKDDFSGLLETGKVSLERQPNGLDKVLASEVYEGVFNRFWTQVEKGNVFRVNGEFVVWLTSPDKLSAFDKAFILTYQFDGSEMAGWMRLYGLGYDRLTVEDRRLVPYFYQSGHDFADLITIIEDRRLNKIGNRKEALTVTWYAKNRGQFNELKRNTRAFFRSRADTPPSQNMFATFNDYRSKLRQSPYGFTVSGGVTEKRLSRLSDVEKAEMDCHVAFNSRATNLYRHKQSLAYLVNVFPNPVFGRLFSAAGVPFDQDRYALNTLLQWIWRSRIRDGEPIILYLPSQRMRRLLEEWLGMTEEIRLAA